MLKSTVRSLLFLGILLLSGPGCRSAQDQVKQDAVIQSEQGVDAARRAEETVVAGMEKTLARRHRLYLGLAGRYSGKIPLSRGAGVMIVSVNFTPTVWPYHGDHPRTREEVASDLERLGLNADLHVDAGSSANFGCIFTGVQPDPSTGQIFLDSDHCLYSVQLLPTDGTRRKSGESDAEIATQLTDQIFDGKISRYSHVLFEATSTVNGLRFSGTLLRIGNSSSKP
jgi:hypothetical protein